MHKLKKSECGLIEVKFVNTRILLAWCHQNTSRMMFMRNRESGCSELRLLGILVRHNCRRNFFALESKLCKLNFVVKH